MEEDLYKQLTLTIIFGMGFVFGSLVGLIFGLVIA